MRERDVRVRFDDSLRTVLAADASTDFGARLAFRQLVDLAARGRVPVDAAMIARLESLRPKVPSDTRAAVARGLALADPPRALVGFFAADTAPVASAALRAARLGDADWAALLPDIGPTGRAVLRARDELSDAVRRALDSFGATDFALAYDAPPPATPVDQPTAPPVGASPFVSLAAIADTLPIVAEARRRAATSPAAAPSSSSTPPRFEIAELVDRIAAFQRDRDGAPPDHRADEASNDERATTDFAYETDAEGTIRWVDAHPRGAIVGLSIARVATDGSACVDGVAAGAFRQRTGFGDARLDIGGASVLGGDWRISGVPLFDPASGRFIGFRGRARRARRDENAAGAGRSASEGLRRLVHELRTPTNAIAGFSELIETQLLGPVASPYRARAAAIRAHAADLVAAIDDLDLAARIEGDALDLRTGTLALAPLLSTLACDLTPLATLRGCEVALDAVADDLLLACDDRIAERLIGRLLAALVSAAVRGERIVLTTDMADRDTARIALTRPRALAAVPEAALLSLDAEREAELPGAPLLGTGFALRLARNLARELGGGLTIGATRLTLTLPAVPVCDMGRASTI